MFSQQSNADNQEGFRVSRIIDRKRVNRKRRIARKLADRKHRIERRLNKTKLDRCDKPVFSASNIHYELGDRLQGFAHGGIGVIHALVRYIGLIDAIDARLFLLKQHFPYHESDHVLNFAYNALCDGDCLQDIELRRNDEVFLNALGAKRIPDPTTAGDFCRRFKAADVRTLLDIFDDVRIGVWAKQPDAFFNQATLDMDGSLVPTTGQCKAGMDIAYDGTWGYHAFVLSLAETKEVLSLVNRSGNRPSHEGAAEQVDRALATCFRGGFRRVLLRGDTDFSQTQYLDGWHADSRVRFIFGYDNKANLARLADDLPATAWQELARPARYTVKTQPRRRPENVKEKIVVEREFANQRLESESVAEFDYRPSACGQTYRMVVLRKSISMAKGERLLFDRIVYFFYITNDRDLTAAEVVFSANDRCDQENLLAQLHSGTCALRAPVNDLESNWAYMVMTALAWNLKAWCALLLPELPGRWQEQHRRDKHWVLRIEFKTFVNVFMRLPCQLVRTGRKLVYRLLSWNPYQTIFFRLVSVLRC
jgi:Transposase DDE domain group 1